MNIITHTQNDIDLLRVQKRTAEKLFNEGNDIYLAGDKYFLNSEVNRPNRIYYYEDGLDIGTFDKWVNNWWYYNSELVKNSILYFKKVNLYPHEVISKGITKPKFRFDIHFRNHKDSMQVGNKEKLGCKFQGYNQAENTIIYKHVDTIFCLRYNPDNNTYLDDSYREIRIYEHKKVN